MMQIKERHLIMGPSVLATRGKTFQHKFTEAGKHSYFCELHPIVSY